MHLDEMRHKKELKSVISLVKNAAAPTTVLIFVSPQSLTDKFPSFVVTIRSLIRFVVIDELHLSNSFGRSLRKEFTLIKDKMLSILIKEHSYALYEGYVQITDQRIIPMNDLHVHYSPRLANSNGIIVINKASYYLCLLFGTPI